MNYTLSDVLGRCEGSGHSAICGGKVYTSIGRHVHTSDSSTGRVQTTSYESPGLITNIAVSRCSKLLLLLNDDSHGVIYSTVTHSAINRIKCRGQVYAASFDASSSLLAVGTDSYLEVWAVETNCPISYNSMIPLIRRFKMHAPVSCLSWGLSDSNVIIGSSDRAIKVLSLSAKYFVHIATHRSKVLAVTINKDASLTHSISADGALMKTKESGRAGAFRIELCEVLHLSAEAVCADFSSCTSVVCVGTVGGQLKVFDTFSYLEIFSVSIRQTRPDLISIAFDPLREAVLIATDNFNEVHLWEYKLDRHIVRACSKLQEITTVGMSSTGSMMATGTTLGDIQLWAVSSKSCRATFSEHADKINQILFFSDNNCFVSSSMDGTVRAFDLARYRNFRIFTAPNSGGVTHIALDRSDEVLCGTTKNGFNILVWSVLTGQLLEVLMGHQSPITSIAVCCQTSHVISSSWDGSARIWDLYGQNRQVELFNHAKEIQSAALSPCGSYLAVVSTNSTTQIWNIRKSILHGSIQARVGHKQLTRDQQSEADCASLQFIHNSSILVSVESNSFLCMHDVQTCSLVKRIQLPRSRGSRSDSVVQVVCADDGASICVALSKKIFIFTNSANISRCADYDESSSHKHLHLAIQSTNFSEALSIATRLSNQQVFFATLNAIPPSHWVQVTCSLQPDIFKDFIYGLFLCMKSSVHIQNILVLLKELCHHRCDLLSMQDCVSNLKVLAKEINISHVKMALTSSKNKAFIDLVVL